MGVVSENTILGRINNFGEFINGLAVGKDELRELKGGLLIYNDPAFMKSIKTGLKKVEEGAVVKCEGAGEVKTLFESL